jgi:1-acyl-sn-glycerol-3-phosphate acyltransferase
VKTAFYYIYTLYCLIIFILLLVLVTPLYLIIFSVFPKSRSPHVAHALSRIWGGTLMFLFGMRLDIIRNKHLIDPSSTYVFVANHLSMLDIPIYARSCRNTFRFLAKKELTRIPLFGYLVEKLYITVDRRDKADRGRSLDKMRQSLENNISVFLAPEGTRNRSGNPLLDFKDGAFRLALATGKPLGILTITNTHHYYPPGQLYIRPGRLHAEWSEPVETKGMNITDVEKLKQIAREKMLEVLKKHRAVHSDL